MLSIDGVCAEHLPTVKGIIDLLKNDAKGDQKKTPGNDSSIEEPDLERELVQLDEFESLFRVAPSRPAANTEERKHEANGQGEFKIQRKSTSSGADAANNMKVKVSGGLPDTSMRDEERKGSKSAQSSSEKPAAVSGMSALRQAAILREQRRL